MKAHTMIRFLLKTMLIIVPLIAWHSTWGAPTVQQISYSNLGTLEIHGSGFGLGPKVVLFDNFEHGAYFSDELSSVSSAWHSQSLIYQEETGNRVHRAKRPTQGSMAQLIVNFRDDYTEAFISYSVKVPRGTTFAGAANPRTFPSVSSWKFTWLMHGSEGFRNSGGFDVCLPSHVGGGSFLLGGNDGNLSWIDHGSDWWDWDDFNHMTSYVRFDPQSPATGPIQTEWSVVNGRGQIQRKIQADPTKLTSQVFAFDRINIPGWWGNGDNSRFDGLYDNLYVAVGPRSLARVVLTDQPDVNASKKQIVLMASSWTDSRIVLDANALPKDGAYFLHIFDASNKPSTGSFRICPTCPATPQVF